MQSSTSSSGSPALGSVAEQFQSTQPVQQTARSSLEQSVQQFVQPVLPQAAQSCQSVQEPILVVLQPQAESRMLQQDLPVALPNSMLLQVTTQQTSIELGPHGTGLVTVQQEILQGTGHGTFPQNCAGQHNLPLEQRSIHPQSTVQTGRESELSIVHGQTFGQRNMALEFSNSGPSSLPSQQYGQSNIVYQAVGQAHPPQQENATQEDSKYCQGNVPSISFQGSTQQNISFQREQQIDNYLASSGQSMSYSISGQTPLSSSSSVLGSQSGSFIGNQQPIGMCQGSSTGQPNVSHQSSVGQPMISFQGAVAQPNVSYQSGQQPVLSQSTNGQQPIAYQGSVGQQAAAYQGTIGQQSVSYQIAGGQQSISQQGSGGQQSVSYQGSGGQPFSYQISGGQQPVSYQGSVGQQQAVFFQGSNGQPMISYQGPDGQATVSYRGSVGAQQNSSGMVSGHPFTGNMERQQQQQQQQTVQFGAATMMTQANEQQTIQVHPTQGILGQQTIQNLVTTVQGHGAVFNSATAQLICNAAAQADVNGAGSQAQQVNFTLMFVFCWEGD